MAVNSAATIKAAVAAILKKASADDLPSYWDEVISQSLDLGYLDVLGALLNRGFTQAEALSCDTFAAWEKDQAIYWSLVRGGGLDAYSMDAANALDKREMLKSALVFVNGVWIKPLVGPGLAVSSGTLDAGGIFEWPDSDSTQRW